MTRRVLLNAWRELPEDAVKPGRSAGRVFALACAILLSAGCRNALASPVVVPEWVSAAAAQAVPAYPAETRAVELLDEDTYTVGTDGRAVEHVRRVFKILRPQGRDQAMVRVPFDNETKILSMNVWSIGADGHQYQMKSTEFSDLGYGDGFIAYQDDKYRQAQAPGADVGAVIAYEYEHRTRPFLTEKTWFFQDDIPRLRQSFTLRLPAGYSYGTVWANHAPVVADDTEHGSLRWEMKETPGIDLERVALAPAGMSLAGRMTIHYGGPGVAVATEGTWKSVGEWYSQLSKDRLTTSPELTRKAEELTAGKTDFFDKAEAIAKFLQEQVRYVAIEIGVGGYQPHAASDVFRNRYGDCKDKSTLTSAMLAAVGIHSALVMVDVERGVVVDSAPSLVADHMVAAIEIPVGYDSPRLRSVVKAKTGRRYLIFDPTWNKTPFGQLEHELQGSYGVLMEGAESEAIRLPVLDPAWNTLHRTADFYLSADGGLKGAVTEKRFGDLAEGRRVLYTAEDAKEQRESLDRVLGHDLTAFTVSDVKVENADALDKDLTLSYRVTADRYAKTMGASLLMIRPRVLGDLGFDEKVLNPERKIRNVPIDLGQTMQVKDDYSIELPAGYVVDELPDPVDLDLGFASYQSGVTVKGSTMRYTRTYTVRQVTLPAERFADLQKLARVIGVDEESKAMLKKQ
ncbi:MAG TPA: DUF3857 and transglutaminase domain-containing protein [Acidobacteriaceae bacterium]|nr:DUF3857 and transglutaminase domain-containing protein [Acidobacteriaceae bacterium]